MSCARLPDGGEGKCSSYIIHNGRFKYQIRARIVIIFITLHVDFMIRKAMITTDVKQRLNKAIENRSAREILVLIRDNETARWIIDTPEYALRVYDSSTGDTLAHRLVEHRNCAVELINTCKSADHEVSKRALEIWSKTDLQGWSVGHTVVIKHPDLIPTIFEIEDRNTVLMMLSPKRVRNGNEESILDFILHTKEDSVKAYAETIRIIRESMHKIEVQKDNGEAESVGNDEADSLEKVELAAALKGEEQKGGEPDHHDAGTSAPIKKQSTSGNEVTLRKIPSKEHAEKPAAPLTGKSVGSAGTFKADPILEIEEEIELLIEKGELNTLRENLRDDLYSTFLVHKRIGLDMKVDDNGRTLLHEIVKYNSVAALELLNLDSKEGLQLLSISDQDGRIVGEEAVDHNRKFAAALYGKPWCYTLLCSNMSYLAEYAIQKHRSAAPEVMKNEAHIRDVLKDEPSRAEAIIKIARRLLELSAAQRRIQPEDMLH